MQNLFATGVNPTMPGMTGITLNNNQGTVPTNNNLPQNININDFNTMQNLFATGAISFQPPSQQGATGIGNISSVSSSSSATTGTTGATDFNTMQNLFSTGNQGAAMGVNQGGFTMAQMQSNPALNMNLGTTTQAQTSTTTTGGATDFNTMQNLFATGAQQPALTQQQLQQLSQQQNININDFNTMQNLFKTGAVSLTPPSQQSTTTKV